MERIAPLWGSFFLPGCKEIEAAEQQQRASSSVVAEEATGGPWLGIGGHTHMLIVVCPQSGGPGAFAPFSQSAFGKALLWLEGKQWRGLSIIPVTYFHHWLERWRKGGALFFPEILGIEQLLSWLLCHLESYLKKLLEI